MKRRVVVTGIGTINPLGHDAITTWEAAKSGTNGIDFIKRIDTTNLETKIAAEVKDFDVNEYLGRKEARRLDRFTQFSIIASDEAIKDAAFDMETLDKDRVGVYYSSGIGGLETIAQEHSKGLEKGFHRISPFFIPSSIINIAAGNIAIKYGFHGPATASVTACASATNTIGEAFRAIRDGYLEVAISGGSEASITDLGLAGFYVMQALSDSDDPAYSSTPFDLNRSGFVMGEGAATLILESYEHAKARGAKIYGEIVGYGATCDATHITSPDPEGTGAMNCMRIALADGNVPLEDVGYINAHGTSTPLNDRIESLAIKRLFNEHAYKLSVSSTKSMTGHLLGASGAIEAIFSILALRDGFIPPTIGYKTPDPNCDLDYTINKGKEKNIQYALSNSLGFGGHNATVVFKKWEE
ncbi:MAG: beta-ketoacyl-ACP synthase II [Candidatus Izemoplasmataceae bacterium]|jgi:3-oxoacyl-[acyl-carrier-protein] synthase II